MSLTYRTVDQIQVALDHVTEIAGRHGFQVTISFPRDPLPGEGETDALVYDLDFLGLDAQGRRELVERLAATPSRLPTAVHGFGLEGHEVETLRRNGLVASDHLNDSFFAELAAKILGASGTAVA
jgi:hypothetical protein